MVKAKFLRDEHKQMTATVCDVVPLKMICNDFLVVKVNCWWYVFNIIQSI